MRSHVSWPESAYANMPIQIFGRSFGSTCIKVVLVVVVVVVVIGVFANLDSMRFSQLSIKCQRYHYQVFGEKTVFVREALLNDGTADGTTW